MTSVKDFEVSSSADRSSLGRGAFVFTDRYSVFDWGEMPDHIPGKGKSLCTMGAYNFELFEEEGIPNHYLGVGDNDSPCSLNEVTEPPERMVIELTQVPDLPVKDGEYDYDEYFQEAGDNYLIPLEIVFRNSVSPGSSLRDRYTPAQLNLTEDRWPDETVKLPEPLVEFSTKYEEQDRYLDEAEAARLAGQADPGELRRLALRVNEVITDRASERGLVHQDGKIECLYYEGTIKVADVAGTFDENRFALDGRLLSKEYLRQYYRKNHPVWYEAVTSAKEKARNTHRTDWKSLCDVTPEPLPEELVRSASDLYRAGTNLYTGRQWFDVPELEEILGRLEQLA